LNHSLQENSGSEDRRMRPAVPQLDFFNSSLNGLHLIGSEKRNLVVWDLDKKYIFYFFYVRIISLHKCNLETAAEQPYTQARIV